MGTLDFGGNGAGVLDITASVDFADAKAVVLNAAGTLQQNDSAGAVFTGTILGNGSLIKSGSGSLMLSGDNSYGGGTDVLAGALLVANADALPAGSSLTVDAGAAMIFDPLAAGGAIADAGPSAVPEP